MSPRLQAPVIPTHSQLTTPHAPTPLARAGLGRSRRRRNPRPATHRRVLAYYADVGHPAGRRRRDRLVRRLPRRLPGARRHRLARARCWRAPTSRGASPRRQPRPGAIAVLSRGSDPTLGHVGFLVGSTPTDVILLGGNQGDAVTVAAFPRARLLGTALARGTATSTAPPPPVIPEAEPARLSGTQPRTPSSTRALAHVLEMEGGWADDPYDPGGPTNLGITLADFARDKGVERHRRRTSPPAQGRAAIHPAVHRPPHLPRPLLAPCVLPADCRRRSPSSTSTPPSTRASLGAARMLQQAVGADDRRRDRPARRSARRRASRRPTRSRSTPTSAAGTTARSSTFWRFGNGWLARVDRTLAAALQLSLHSALPHPATQGADPWPTHPASLPPRPRRQMVGPVHDHLGRHHHHPVHRAARHRPAARPQHHRRAGQPARRPGRRRRAGRSAASSAPS